MEVITNSNFRRHLKDYMRQIENNYIYSNSQYVDMLIHSKKDIDEGKGTRITINSMEDLLNL